MLLMAYWFVWDVNIHVVRLWCSLGKMWMAAVKSTALSLLIDFNWNNQANHLMYYEY